MYRNVCIIRLCFIVTLFFSLMAIITIGVNSSNDFRAGIQNGFWGLKYLLIIGGMIGAFFIPEDHFGKCGLLRSSEIIIWPKFYLMAVTDQGLCLK